MFARVIPTILKPTMGMRFFASAAYSLPPLPYGKKDLEPVISEKTMNCHYDGHHKTYGSHLPIHPSYVTNLNNLTKDAERLPLEHYIVSVKGPLHNQAAQVLHSHSLSRRSGTTPSSGSA